MPHYFSAELSEDHRNFIVAAMRTLMAASTTNYGLGPPELPSPLTKTHREVVELLQLAPRIELPLAVIDWAAVEQEAARRGSSLADLIWDQGAAGDTT